MSLKHSDIESTAQETELLRRWSCTKLENFAANAKHKNVSSETPGKVLKSDGCSVDVPDIDRDFAKILSASALRQLFQKPEVSVLDGLNEYDDDFTYFAPRGEVITHEMQRVAGELGDRMANVDEGEAAELQGDQINGTFASAKNAKLPEDEEAGGNA